MKIGIDARLYMESGVGRYLRNLITNLQKIDKKNEYFIFLLPKDYQQFETTQNFQKVEADFSWYGFAEQFKFPKLLNQFKLDLIHFPHFNIPIFYNGKFVVTIHDLIHQHHVMKRATTLNPLTYKFKQFGYKKVFKHAVQKSEKILVPSHYVKNLLFKEWGVRNEKITVTCEAVDDQMLKMSDKIKKERIDKILETLHIRQPFLFYVGNAHPHKNVEGLIKAFLILKSKYPNLQLVLSGQDHYFWQRIKEENQHENIIFTGQVSEEQLIALYKGAQAFVQPSFEEGFGIPLLEAMALGCPVVSSSFGSLSEIGGEACLYFNPKDSEDMVLKITSILNDKKLRDDLISKGGKRYKKFQWNQLVRQTLEVYESSYSS